MTNVRGGGDLGLRLQQWSKAQGLGNDATKLNVGQMQEAARALSVPLADVVAAREELVSKSAGQTEQAGQAFAATRNASQGASLGQGGVRMDRSPVMGRFAFEPKLGSKGGAGKGSVVGKGSGPRFEPKLQAKNDLALRQREDRAMTTLYFKSDYNYLDAEAVQRAFQFDSVGQAKAYIGLKIAQDNEFLLAEKGITPSPYDDHEMIEAFASSKHYTYADAEKAVASFSFLSTIEEAKAYIGLKITNGTEDILHNAGIGGGYDYGVTDGDMNGGDMGLYFKSQYSYTDAEKVMSAFGLPNVEAAKVYISDKIMLGNTHLLDEIGVTQHPWDSHEELAAFSTSKTYTVDDAFKALKAFDFLSNIQEAKGYIGLKIINGTESILKDAGIGVRSENVSVGPNVRASSLDARFTTKTTEEKGVLKGKGENGEPATLDWSHVKLQVTDKTTRKSFTIGDNKAGVDEMKNMFKDGAYGMPEWSVGASYDVVGGAGKYLSISENGHGYSGGAHGWAGSSYATFDATTGKQVSASDLLGTKAAKAAIEQAVSSLKGAVDNEAYLMGSSDKDIADTISKSFAVFSENGVAKLAFGHPHTVEAARGTLLEAVVDAPKTKAFYEKIGLDHGAAANTALGEIVGNAPPAFPGSDIPYTAVSMDDVNKWLADWFGPTNKMTKADKEAASAALYDAGAGAAMGVRMMMHELAEELSPIETEE